MNNRKKTSLLLIGLLIFGGCGEKIRKEKIEEKINIENIEGIDFQELRIEHGLYFQKKKKEPFTGIALEKYPSGKIRSVKEFVAGRLNGKMQNYYETGEIAEITYYENGKAQGEVVLFQKIVREYDDGAIKQQTYYHTNGNKAHTTSMLPNWKAEGIQEHYWGDGKIRIKIPHKDGKRHGMAEYYKQDGTLEKTENYENGQLQK